MLYYTEAGLSHLEVPDETALCIYISGCSNRCANCHYPQLQLPDYGDMLKAHFSKLVDLYSRAATCVVFLGEGRGTSEDREELLGYCGLAHTRGMKTCLYSGRDTQIEDWMQNFDYIKLGSYDPKYGPLNVPTTNQRMFKKTKKGYVDITNFFWRQCAGPFVLN